MRKHITLGVGRRRTFRYMYNCRCRPSSAVPVRNAYHEKAAQVHLLGEAVRTTPLTPIAHQAYPSALSGEEASQAWLTATVKMGSNGTEDRGF